MAAKILPFCIEKVVCNNCGKLVGFKNDTWVLKAHNMVRNTRCPQSGMEYESWVIYSIDD